MSVNVSEATKPKKCLGVRHIQVLMLCLGSILAISTRTVMSVAIVDMTDPSNDNHFDWTLQKQSVILSSYTWGYVVLQLFAGALDRRFGGMALMVMCVGGSSVFSLLLPASAYYGGWITVCICRGIQGLMQCTLIPTLTSLVAKWVPVNERARTIGFILGGGYLGIALQFFQSGYIAHYWGWPMIFYVNGIVSVIWTLVYLYIGSDSPQTSKFMSTEERFSIQSSLGTVGVQKKLKTPWKSILTSWPVFANMIANLGFSWGYWLLLSEIPTYMSKVLQIDIKSNGLMSSLPFVTLFLMNFPVGFTSDYLIKKNWVQITSCRKIFNSIGFFGPALSLVCLTFVPPGNLTLAVVALCATLGLKSGYYSGFIVSYIDMSPNFTSTIVAIANCTANVVGLFAPMFVGLIVKDDDDPKEWHIVFYVSAMIYIVTNIIYIVFASSELQKWNDGAEPSEKTIKL